MHHLACFALLVPGLALATAVAGAEEAEDPTGWSFSGEISFITTEGNTEAETLGIAGTAVRAGERDELSFAAGGLRAESTTVSRAAVGTPDDFELVERSETQRTAENVYARGRYQRDLGPRLFWFAGASWERDELAGFRSRASAVGGVGRTWWKTDRSHVRTDAGLTYTLQDDVVVSDAADDFLGLRLGYDLARQLTATTDLTSVLTVDQSLDDIDDLRADFLNAVAVGINDLLSVKVSLHLRYDKRPALAAVPLVDPAGTPTGSVLVELDRLDRQLTLALVLQR